MSDDVDYAELARKAANDEDYLASIAYSLLHRNEFMSGPVILLKRISDAMERISPRPEHERHGLPEDG